MEENDNECFQLLCTLKSQIFVGDRLSSDYEEILKDLLSLVTENKIYLRFLEKCNFITDKLLLTLKYDCSYDIGLQFITEMIRLGFKIPSKFYSKKFIFFITEKLYENMDDSSTNVDFVTTLIENDRSFISIFNDCGYFSLVNSLITEKTAKLYSQIFKGYEERKIKDRNTHKKHLNEVSEDFMFEIQRKNFDSEIIFRDCGIISFKYRKPTFKGGNSVLDELFNTMYNCNLYNLLNISVEDIISVLSYRNIKCDWLLDEPIFLELAIKGDLSALRVLRNILCDCKENVLIKLDEMDYLGKVVKLLDDGSQSIRFEVVMGLCLYTSRVDVDNYSPFTEKRIRSIFSLLESFCIDCPCSLKNCRVKTQQVSDGTGQGIKGDNSLNTDIDNIEGLSQSIYTIDSTLNEKISTKKDQSFISSKTVMNTSMFQSDISCNQKDVNVTDPCLKDCDTLKILNLIFLIYHKHKKEYFYKISYVFLLKNLRDVLKDHVCINFDPFYSFFDDIISFIRSKDKNISRIIFPFQLRKKGKGEIVNETNNDDLNLTNEFE